MKKFKNKVICCDVDGTLIDDAVTSLNCVNDMLAEMNKPLISLEQYYTYVETPIIGFYRHILTEDELDFPVISKSFISIEFYGGSLGASTTRRSTYYAAILAWAGIVENHRSKGNGGYISVNPQFRS